MTRYLAFDIEISKPLPAGESDWKSHRPLGISCAATLCSDDAHPTLWYSAAHPDPELFAGYAPAMRREDVCELVDYLWERTQEGYTVLTFNGLGFDFDILAEESGLFDKCRELATHHVDMMFQFFALRGHYIGLDKVAKGAGLPGKTEGMNGAQAPILWQQGAYQDVLKYVSQDARTTLDVALAVEKQKRICWVSNSGRHNAVPIDRWLTVSECMDLPEPDQSWMSNPVSRSKFIAWTLE